MEQWLRSAIFRRIVLSMLAVSLIPLLLISALAWRSLSQAGALSITRSREALDAKSAGALELRTIETAAAIARFLQDREEDLRTLALIPCTTGAYLAFSQAHSGEIWYLADGREVRETIPLYREIACIEADGQEAVRIVDNQVVPAGQLRNVSDPANTTYGTERYFAETRGLPPGEIYVGHVIGYYVSREQFLAGRRFEGLLRFAMPIFDGAGSFDGIVMLALDSRHLAEFTEHIVPTDERFAAAPDPATGNYAYLIDNQANTLAHPNDFLQGGVDEHGQPLPIATRAEEIGVLPVRLDMLGFVDQNLASIPGLVAQGNAGSIQYYWAGHNKFAAYAPIPYYGGSYEPPMGFGWVGISADVDTFHEAANHVAAAIEDHVRRLTIVSAAITILTLLIVIPFAALRARQISDPVRRITEAARSVERNEFHLEMLEPLLTQRREDEMAHLARVFSDMAAHVQRREQLRRLLDVVISIGVALPQERNFNRLLETVVLEAMRLCNADGGTLYLREGDLLRFAIVRNETLGIALGGTTGQDVPYPPVPLFDENGAPDQHSVAARTVHTATTINVPDVYEAADLNFSGTRAYDERTGYRSRSFLCVPLTNDTQEVIGVLQLINARDPNTGEVIAFDAGLNRVIESLAALGTVAVKAYLREMSLRQQIEQLRIEINEARREQEVAEITETDYFQQLQRKARALRERRRRRSE